jgi:S-DNA-T family DNA segregation ATPase FtsK/SpoIIIE
LAGTLAGRLPPPNVSRREFQQRSWWEGPELYLVIDDYDMVAGNHGSSPLQPLLDLVPHGREIGFHIVLTRGSGGFARASMADPVLVRIRELGAAGLVLSADPREGTLLGGVRGAETVPGRGVLVRRRRQNELVQILLGDAEPDEDGGA